MKNKEKYANEIIEVAIRGETLAFNKVTNKVCLCVPSIGECDECLFHNVNRFCYDEMIRWFNAEVEEDVK